MTAFAGAACSIGQSGIWRASRGNLNPETPNPAIGVSPRPWAFFVLTYPSPEGGFADAEKGGGIARAESLSSEERKAIARKAAVARWGLVAIHKGNFKEEFGIDVDCYVLNDDAKTAVISKRGMGAALGYTGQGGTNFLRLIKQKTMSEYVGPELAQKIENPIKFQRARADPENQSMPTIHGYDVTILIDVCQAIIRAEVDKKLKTNQAEIAKQAHIILNASAKSGIKGLVYALAGYRPEVQEVKDKKEYEGKIKERFGAQEQEQYSLSPTYPIS